MKDKVLEALAGTELATARVDASIVEALGRALNVLCGRHTKQQEVEAAILLRAACELFRLFREGLRQVAKLLAPLLEVSSSTNDDDDDDSEAATEATAAEATAADPVEAQ